MFNGVGDEAHETLAISRTTEDFDFCKTARKPYDLAVTASLIAFQRMFIEGDKVLIDLTSDGEDEGGWNEGIKLYESLFKK